MIEWLLQKLETKIIKVNASNIDIISEAAEIIKNGDLVAFPTETVYGLGADGFNEEARQKIYEVKGRPTNKPLSLLVSSRKMIEKIAIISSIAEKLIDKFMPGPLTLILKSRNKNNSTIGVRMPDNAITLKLIELSNCPIAAPSANPSGQPPPTTAQEVLKSFEGKIPLILDGGVCKFGMSSTIVDVSGNELKILRDGAITREEIFSKIKS